MTCTVTSSMVQQQMPKDSLFQDITNSFALPNYYGTNCSSLASPQQFACMLIVQYVRQGQIAIVDLSKLSSHM